MREKCDGFKKRIRVSRPYEYFNLINQLQKLVKDNTFRYKGEYPLEELKEGKQFADDFIEHTFWCRQCNQEFRLYVETYHGSGGSWQPVDPV